MAAITLLGYDHLVTLDREIAYVWSARKNSIAFYLYVFNRFFSLTYLIFDSVPLTKSGVVSSKICVIYLMCNDIVTLIQTLLIQVILQLRVYALYERSKTILMLLLTFCALEIAAMASLVGVTIGHLEHIPVVSTPTGCFYRGLLNASALFWVPGLVFEPLLCVLVIYKAWSREKQGRRIPLMVTVARDSLIYFAVIFIVLLASTIIWARNPTYINMIMPWSAALPSILGSRLLLNMREKVHRSGEENSYIMETIGHPHMNTLTLLDPYEDPLPVLSRHVIGDEVAGERVDHEQTVRV